MNKPALVCASLVFCVVLAACGTATPPAPTATLFATSTPPLRDTLTPTPDLCSPAAIPNSVSIINQYVKAFEKYESLAVQSIPPAALLQLIATMKDIRAATFAQPVPPCLVVLKHDALLWMDTTIQTLDTVQGNPTCVPSAPAAQQQMCAATLSAGGVQARKYNDEYAAELGRLIGVTLAAPGGTPGTPGSPQPEATSTPLVVMVVNPGPNPVNLRSYPFLSAQTVGSLAANVGTIALGKTTNGDWLLVQIPGKPGKQAWVYATLVEFTNGNLGELPVTAH